MAGRDDPAAAPTGADETTSAATAVKHSAVRNFFWGVVSTFTNRFAQFAGLIILARLLTPEDFGVVAGATSLMIFLDVGVDDGLGSALIYHQEKGITRRVQTAFTVNLILMTVLTVAASLLGYFVLAAFQQSPEYRLLFAVVPLSLLLRSFGQINDAILQRDLQFKKRTVADTGRAVTRFGVSIALALSGFGPWAIVVGGLASDAVGSVLNWIMVPFVPRFTIDRDLAKGLLKFGMPLVGMKALSQVGTNADYFIVGHRLGPTALGEYKIAFQLPELVISNTLWVFSSVAYPTYARARTIGDDVFRRAALKSLRVVTLFGFPVGVGLAIVAQPFILVFFGDKWAGSVATMSVIAVALGISSIGYGSGDVYTALGRPGLMLGINVPFAIGSVLGFVFAARYGIVWVAVVHLVSKFLYAVTRLVLADRIIGTRLREDFAAMRPAIVTTLGIVVFAVPVRLIMNTPDVVSLVAIVAAGCAGGALGMTLFARDMFAEIRDLAASFRRRESEATALG
ncbi:MAG: lipopolysaccharide biosynthesis protein [Acidimicrobiia bacterium]